eukprot:UN14668
MEGYVGRFAVVADISLSDLDNADENAEAMIFLHQPRVQAYFTNFKEDRLLWK